MTAKIGMRHLRGQAGLTEFKADLLGRDLHLDGAGPVAVAGDRARVPLLGAGEVLEVVHDRVGGGLHGEGALHVDMQDDIVAACLVAHEGILRKEG